MRYAVYTGIAAYSAIVYIFRESFNIEFVHISYCLTRYYRFTDYSWSEVSMNIRSTFDDAECKQAGKWSDTSLIRISLTEIFWSELQPR